MPEGKYSAGRVRCGSAGTVLIGRIMRISPDEVRHVAKLARLRLSEEEITSLAADMAEILTYVEKLDGLDTAGVEPTSCVVASETAFRKDVVTNEPSPEDAVANAPKKENNFFFVVPNIIE